MNDEFKICDMARIPKRMIRQINEIHVVDKILSGVLNDVSWLNDPPEFWHEHETQLFDAVCNTMDLVKSETLKILNGSE